MKKLIIALSLLLLLSSCGTSTVNSLYYWGGVSNGVTNYEHLTYKEYKNQTPEMICKLIALYENMITKPIGTRKMPPPGIFAEYGYLLLQPNTATLFMENAKDSQRALFNTSDYASLFREKGREMLEMEIEFYPESRHFIEPLIKKLTHQL